MKKRSVALLLCVILLAGLLPLGANAKTETTVYQMAVNDRFLTPSESPMPVAVGGTIYVPYSVFDRDVTGVNLGISCILNQAGEARVLTLASIGGMLTFDVNAQSCIDIDGNSHSMRAIVRNGRIFVPVSGVVNYFKQYMGLDYVQRPTDYGVLIRITNNNVSLSVDRFIESAASNMKGVYDDYIKSLLPKPAPNPVPAVSTAPAITASPGETPKPDRSTVRVYLAVTCAGGGHLEAILEDLMRYDAPALFLFQPDALAENADLVRHILGAGQSIGLTAMGADTETLLHDLAEGNDLLARIAWTRTYTAYVPNAPTAVCAALEAEGWNMWMPNIAGISGGDAVSAELSRVLKEMELKSRVARVTLDDSASAAAAFPRLLAALRANKYNLRLATETEL